MWPSLSETKPDPSACSVCFCWKPNGFPNGSSGVSTDRVVVIWTTPGAERPKISLIVSPLGWLALKPTAAFPGVTTSRTVVVSPLPPKRRAAPASASAAPARPAPTSAATEVTMRLREVTDHVLSTTS